jgi:hypothetical protein
MPATVSQITQTQPNNVAAVTTAVNNYNASLGSNQYQLNVNDVLAVVAIESSGKQFGPDGNVLVGPQNPNGTYDYGIMQLNSGTYPDAASLSMADNITKGVAQLGNNLQNNGGNMAAAVQAYNTGSPDGYASSTYVQNWQTAGGATDTSTVGEMTDPLAGGNIPPTAQAYVPLSNNAQNVDLTALVPMIVIQEGLNVKPWYQDAGLVTGNPRLRAEVQPVTFEVLLHNNTYFILAEKGQQGQPIQVRLNASMKSVNWSMKHIYHHQHTRTAQHITMWGLQADTIEGQCSTGVFMNQFGLTDYYSTRTINDNLKKLVGSMFLNLPSGSGTSNNTPLGGNASVTPSSFSNLITVDGPNGQSVTTSTGGSPSFTATINSAARNNPNFSQTSAFRVAAQDAFMEFLALFKMNGNVWFWNKTYQDNMGETRDWTSIQAWSPTLGLSGAQKNARNNDVLTRGGVIMTYRNFVYQGYFKSLQWQMSAMKPFSWDFSFVFQVERTIGQEFIPG